MITRLVRSLAQPEAMPPPWSFWTAVNTLLVTVVAWIAGSLLLLTALPDQAQAALLGWLLGGIITTLYIWLTRRDREALRLGPLRARLLVVLLLGVGIAVLLDTLGLMLTREFVFAPELLGLVVSDPGVFGWLVGALFMLIVQPVAEELAFRGVFLPAARARFGGWLGWLLSGVLYGLFHLIVYSAGPANLWYMFVTPLLAGLFFGAVRTHTRSTWAAIAAHVGFGLFALLKVIALPLP
jgi:membrane protease YdiL (CAAX protease family)